MSSCCEAYLDIETTGLSPWDSKITVIGIYLCKDEDDKIIQLIGDEATAKNILETLEGVDIIHTYNGSRFDLPFIDYKVGVNLAKLFKHCDLMYDCWNRNLYGGFKSVERQLGIERRLTEINGYEAVRLWRRYINNCDEQALKILLEYNKEDVFNLKRLKEKLLDSDR